jgi:hypothetical protein
MDEGQLKQALFAVLGQRGWTAKQFRQAFASAKRLAEHDFESVMALLAALVPAKKKPRLPRTRGRASTEAANAKRRANAAKKRDLWQQAVIDGFNTGAIRTGPRQRHAKNAVADYLEQRRIKIPPDSTLYAFLRRRIYTVAEAGI